MEKLTMNSGSSYLNNNLHKVVAKLKKSTVGSPNSFPIQNQEQVEKINSNKKGNLMNLRNPVSRKLPFHGSKMELKLK